MSNNKNNNELITSAWNRFWEIGMLSTKIGTSFLTRSALNIFYKDESKDKKNIETWIRNANRMVASLSKLKGAAMKFGQMLSLQEGLVPPEVMPILRALQKDSRPVSFEQIKETLEDEIPDYREKLEYIEETPYASASIGQVHKAKTKNGDEVIVKIQYPGIDRAIEGDLKNLKILFKTMAGWFTKVDVSLIWEEIKQKMLEEIDYESELENQLYFYNAFRNHPQILIPKPIQNLSSKRVITSEYLPGVALEDVKHLSLEERNQWAMTLFEFIIKQLIREERVHTDPNAANFSFLTNGRIIVYDFGNVKKTTPTLRTGYEEVMKASMNDETEKIPQILFNMGVKKINDQPIPFEFVKPYVEIFMPIFREKPYCFGKDKNLIRKVMDEGRKNIMQAMDITFPADMVFIDRTIAGHIGNLNTLAPCDKWEKTLKKILF